MSDLISSLGRDRCHAGRSRLRRGWHRALPHSSLKNGARAPTTNAVSLPFVVAPYYEGWNSRAPIVNL